MSIDSTFKPITETYLVGVSAVQLVEAQGGGVVSFRIRLIVAGPAYLTWGQKSTVTAAGAPAAGLPVVNTVGMAGINTVMYLEVPAGSFFISNTAAAFEITGGEGGNGG